MSVFLTFLAMSLLVVGGAPLHVVGIAGALVLVVVGAFEVAEALQRYRLRCERNHTEFLAAYAAALKRQKEAREACDRG